MLNPPRTFTRFRNEPPTSPPAPRVDSRMPAPIRPASPFLACCWGAGASAASLHAVFSAPANEEYRLIAPLPVWLAFPSGAAKQAAGKTIRKLQRSRILPDLSLFRNVRLLFRP